MDYKKIFGWLFVIFGVLFLVSILGWSLATVQALSNLNHEQQMERLKLEKEIALINNQNNTIIKDYECEYKLANQTISHLIAMRELERYYEYQFNN